MFEKVKEIIVENLACNAEDVTLDKRLIEDLGADSLDAVELSMAFEDEFNIEISDEEFQELKTVKDIVNYLEAKK